MTLSCIRVIGALVAPFFLTTQVQSLGFLLSRSGISENVDAENVDQDNAADGVDSMVDQNYAANDKDDFVEQEDEAEPHQDEDEDYVAEDGEPGTSAQDRAEVFGQKLNNVEREGGEEVEVVAEDGSELANSMDRLLTSLVHTASRKRGYTRDGMSDLEEADVDDVEESGNQEEESSSSSMVNNARDSESHTSENHNIHVAAEVGGNKVEMLVDTGAAISVMSKPLAIRLGLLSRMDQTTQGSIEGIGEAQVLGSLHNIPVKLGQTTSPLSFWVVSVKDPLLLFGVDQMRQFKCVVDLDRNCLVFGGRNGSEIPFLPYQPALM